MDVPMLFGLPKDVTLKKIQALPKVEFEVGGNKYKMTDVRLLHPYGVEVIKKCINTMLIEPDARECKFIAHELDDETIEIIKDIALGFGYDGKIKSKDKRTSRFIGSCIITGVITKDLENGNKELTFRFNYDFAKYACEYHQTHTGSVNITNLIDYVERGKNEEFMEYLKNHKDEVFTA